MEKCASLLRRLNAIFAASLFFALAFTGAARATEFPSRTVKLVVPLAAGSATDIMARTVAKALEAQWKQPVVVENKPGAGGIVAAEYVAKQPADGHTLLLTGPSLVIAPLVDRNAVSRFQHDLVPVARLAVLRIVLATNTKVPAQTLQEFAALSRANPGKMNYAGLGRSSIIDVGIEVLKKGLDMNLVPVSYKGATEHNVALIRDDVQLVWGGASVLREQAAGGEVKILAAVSDQRLAELPDVPTVVEAGHKGFIPRVWTGLIAPARTPASVQEKINRDVNRVLAGKEVAGTLKGVLGNDPAPLPRQAFAAEVAREEQFWQELLRELNIEPI